MNIVLIGIESSGKSTIGKKISELTGMEFIDTDEAMLERARDIYGPFAIFRWREFESEIIKEVSKKENCVISTGALIAEDERNVKCLRKNGIIFKLSPGIDLMVKRQMKRNKNCALYADGNKQIYDESYYRGEYLKNISLYNDYDYMIDVSESKECQVYAKEIIEIFNKCK